MDLKLLKRRAEMLEMVCKRFHPSVVMSQLAEKYHVSERCMWSDWERRETWVPVLLELEKFSGFTEQIESTIKAVQKAAWTINYHADNDNARVGALKVILESLEIHSNTVLTKAVLQRLERVEKLTEKKVVEDKKIEEKQ